MDFAIQRCCTTPIFLKQYDTSIDAVLNKLGVGIIDIKEFNCCGYPLKNINFMAYILASARNLSLAEKRKLDIMTFCNCCYGNLKKVNNILKENKSLRSEINSTLKKEGLEYRGNVKIRHLMEILYNNVGIERIKKEILHTYKGLKVATHYGCHILRPSRLVNFDKPGSASIFDQLVEITGAKIMDWPLQTECCGSPMWGINDDISMDLIQKKIMDVKQSGADYICVACSYCQLQFDRGQKMLQERRGSNHNIPSILYIQLLGLSLGIEENKLGIRQNEIEIKEIKGFFNGPKSS